MIEQFRHRRFSASSPLANALVLVVGALVIGVSIVLGVVAFVALALAALIMGTVIAARVWWLNRKLGRAHNRQARQGQRHAAGGDVIEGEFRVVARDTESDPDS